MSVHHWTVEVPRDGADGEEGTLVIEVGRVLRNIEEQGRGSSSLGPTGEQVVSVSHTYVGVKPGLPPEGREGAAHVYSILVVTR